MRARLGAAVVALCLSVSAEAAIYSGNPHLDLYVTDGGDITGGNADLDAVVLHRCDGSRAIIPVAGTIDPTVGWDADVSAGCYVGVSAVWSSIVTLTGSSLELEYDRVSTYVALSGATQDEEMTPFTIVSGSYSDTPLLVVTLQ